MSKGFQLPQPNEVWRHYKGGMYLIIGIGHDENGMPVVIYADNHEPPGPPYYTRGLATFLQTVDIDAEAAMTGRPIQAGVSRPGMTAKVQRFKPTGQRRVLRDAGPAGWDHDAGIPRPQGWDKQGNGGQL